VIGNGSNLLVRDEGYDGVIIKLGQNFAKYSIEDNVIKCQAGVYVSKIANEAYEHSLSGLEFAAGIPGMIGGAVAMNAGAYGGEFKDVIESVTVIDKRGNIQELSNDEMDFRYRHSIVLEKEYVVLETRIKLKDGNKQEIKSKMEEFLASRREKQPLDYPSAGSTFKRPEGYFAGKLIMDAGLRGYSVGDACVSEKHCGFVINKGNATATDIIKLIDNIKKIVKDKYDVELEEEVKII
jgi:UDP-N-acetylmuramate dehydrogenase